MSEITPNTPNPVREDAYKQQLAAKLGIDPQYIPGSPIWHSEEEIAAIAEMFSNMAGGSSGGGVLVVNEDENSTLDKTYAEIKSASNNAVVLLHSGDDILYLASIGYNFITEAYGVAFFGNKVLNQYEADAENGYPVIVS